MLSWASHFNRIHQPSKLQSTQKYHAHWSELDDEVSAAREDTATYFHWVSADFLEDIYVQAAFCS